MSSSRRRYEITTTKSHRYWEISRTGRRVKVACGIVGHHPKEYAWIHQDEVEATSQMERRARAKLEAGFSLVDSVELGVSETAAPLTNSALEAVIAMDLEAVAPFLVYGDWLVERGDARGEIIALQCNLEGETDIDRFLELQNRVRALLRDNPSILGALNAHQAGLSIGWRRGYVDRLVVRARADTLVCVGEIPRTAATTFLRSLTVEDVDEPTVRILADMSLPHLVDLNIRWALRETDAVSARMSLVESILVGSLAPNLLSLHIPLVGDPDEFVARVAGLPLMTQLKELKVHQLPIEAANRLR